MSQPLPDPPPLDLRGVLLIVPGLAGLTFAVQRLSEPDPGWALVTALGAASLATVLVAVRHLLRVAHPLINLHTLRIATFGASIAGSALYFPVVGAGPFLFPLLFQQIFGWSPIKSGAVLMLLFIGNIAIKPATTFLYGRFGFRALLVVATVGMAATMVAAASLTSRTPVTVIGLVLLLSGIARSIGGTGYQTIAFADVPDGLLRDANTLQATLQQLTLGLGVAVAAVALRVGQPIGALLPGDGSETGAFSVAFCIMAMLSLAATSRALRIDSRAGEALRGARMPGTPS